MKHARKATWFLSGMLCAALLVNTVAPAAAALVAKTIQVYTGIEVFVDDVKIDAGDTHGNPDAFAYNGTTYVAVAAISKSLGEKVYWDGDEKKVYIGEHEGSFSNFIDTYPPYEASGNYKEHKTGKFFTMSGKEYTNGFTIMGFDDASVISNVTGNYTRLEFDVGHIDGASMKTATVSIYLDGQFHEKYTIDPEDFPQFVSIPLEGVSQLKFIVDDGANVAMGATRIGFANMKLY